MNIRPYTDTLRKAYPDFAWRKDYDTVAGGGRSVQLSMLFRGQDPTPFLQGAPSKTGDRIVEVELSDDGRHRTAHALVKRDCYMVTNPSNPKAGPAPTSLHWSTHPTYFATTAEMLAAIGTELTRADHKP